MSNYTQGPWRWEYNPKRKSIELCGGKPRFDRTVMDFVRCGMNGAIPRFQDFSDLGLLTKATDLKQYQIPIEGREHHASWITLFKHPDAILIEKAPELLEALKRLEMLAGSAMMEDDPARASARKLIKEIEGENTDKLCYPGPFIGTDCYVTFNKKIVAKYPVHSWAVFYIKQFCLENTAYSFSDFSICTNPRGYKEAMKWEYASTIDKQFQLPQE